MSVDVGCSGPFGRASLHDLLSSLMGYCFESRRCCCCNELWPTAVPLNGVHGDGLMVFHNALLMRR